MDGENKTRTKVKIGVGLYGIHKGWGQGGRGSVPVPPIVYAAVYVGGMNIYCGHFGHLFVLEARAELPRVKDNGPDRAQCNAGHSNAIDSGDG